MNNDKNKNKRLWFLFAALLILPVAIYGTKLVQDERSHAAGSYEVGMKITPVNGTYHVGDNLKLSLKVNKIALRTINVSGIQAVLNIGDKFVINSVTCLAPFNGLPFTKINGLEVTIFCAIATGASPVTLPTSDMAVATLDLNVDANVTDGVSQITFNSTRVTESGIVGQAPDVSTAGSLSEYTIVSAPACPRGEIGNLDCSIDSCIDTADYELFRQAFGSNIADIYVQQGQSTPDLVVDGSNMVDTADYEILRSNFGSCQ